MKYILLLAILVSVYAGNVIGCVVLCETIPELKWAKEFAWQVPFINLFFAINTLFSSQIGGNRFRLLLLYLKYPCKNVLTLWATSEVIERRESEDQQSNTHMTRQVFNRYKGICTATLSMLL